MSNVCTLLASTASTKNRHDRLATDCDKWYIGNSSTVNSRKATAELYYSSFIL